MRHLRLEAQTHVFTSLMCVGIAFYRGRGDVTRYHRHPPVAGAAPVVSRPGQVLLGRVRKPHGCRARPDHPPHLELRSQACVDLRGRHRERVQRDADLLKRGVRIVGEASPGETHLHFSMSVTHAKSDYVNSLCTAVCWDWNNLLEFVEVTNVCVVQKWLKSRKCTMLKKAIFRRLRRLLCVKFCRLCVLQCLPWTNHLLNTRRLHKTQYSRKWRPSSQRTSTSACPVLRNFTTLFRSWRNG